MKVKKDKPAIGRRPTKAELEKLYVKESKSIREAAETLGSQSGGQILHYCFF